MALEPDRALALLGRILAGRGERYAIVIVGGAALRLRGTIVRATTDVDVIAMVQGATLAPLEEPPHPLPRALLDAASVVASELNLEAHWLNTAVAQQWEFGLPEGMAERLEWIGYDGLRVGIAGRADLIALKLFAATDGTQQGKHFQDLLQLAPSDSELDSAFEWVRLQDASPLFADTLPRVIADVRANRK